MPDDELNGLKRTAIRAFCHFDAMEHAHRRLSPNDFQLKSVVDDFLVRCYVVNAASDALPGRLSSMSPIPSGQWGGGFDQCVPSSSFFAA